MFTSRCSPAIILAGLLFSVPVKAQVPAATKTAVPALAAQLNDAFAGVYEKVAPSVVVIEVRRGPSPAKRLRGMLPDGWELFSRAPDGTQVPLQEGEDLDIGSGFILTPEGYILTNNHVVENTAPGEITVVLKDGRKFAATVAGQDDKTDIAVLKIDAKGLPVAELGDSDAVKVGQFAFAIGAPWELPYTFTTGVISAKGRTDLTQETLCEDYLQTDAAINPGNSGGPLCDLGGKVVGVSTLINGINRGLGFAVPINLARDVAQQLIASGRVVRSQLGIGIKGLAEEPGLRMLLPGVDRGVVVKTILPNTPADRSELRAGDVILAVDGREVALARELQKEILGKKIGQQVELDVWRSGQKMKVVMKTAEQPSRTRVARRAQPKSPAASPDGIGGLGLSAQDLSPEIARSLDRPSIEGAILTEVAPGGAAEVAGLRARDIVTMVGSTRVKNASDLEAALSSEDLSRGVTVLIERGGVKTFALLKK